MRSEAAGRTLASPDRHSAVMAGSGTAAVSMNRQARTSSFGNMRWNAGRRSGHWIIPSVSNHEQTEIIIDVSCPGINLNAAWLAVEAGVGCGGELAMTAQTPHPARSRLAPPGGGPVGSGAAGRCPAGRRRRRSPRAGRWQRFAGAGEAGRCGFRVSRSRVFPDAVTNIDGQ